MKTKAGDTDMIQREKNSIFKDLVDSLQFLLLDETASLKKPPADPDL